MQLVIRKSRRNLICLLVGSLVFVAIGGLMVLEAAAIPKGVALPFNLDQIVWARLLFFGWLSIVFFGCCAAAIVWIIFDPRPRLIFDDEGVFDRTLRVGKIPWSDIRDAYVGSIAGTDFVCLVLHDEPKYLARLSKVARLAAKANKALGFTLLTLNLSGMTIKAKDVVEIIRRCVCDSVEVIEDNSSAPVRREA